LITAFAEGFGNQLWDQATVEDVSADIRDETGPLSARYGDHGFIQRSPPYEFIRVRRLSSQGLRVLVAEVAEEYEAHGYFGGEADLERLVHELRTEYRTEYRLRSWRGFVRIPG
jgi:hypothetical protein